MTSPSDLRRTLNRAALFVSLFSAVAAGCDSCCTEEVLNEQTPPSACVLEDKCDDGEDFRFGECGRGGCLVDADCCPGTRCRPEQNACVPRLLDSEFECESNADCPDPAQVCATIAIGDRPALPVCIFESCTGDAECGFGRACFKNHCVTNAPCGGSCPEGSVCEVGTNSCQELLPAGTKDVNIDASCRAGCDGLLVLKDAATMTGEICCDLQCECVTPPPIVPTRIGRYARIVTTGTEVLVSAYDAEFGDLVVVRHTLGGDRSGIQYVDGVPVEAPTGDPAGARGGVRGVGVNVGTHTAIVANASGLARIAYHDVTNNALKVAIEGPVGVWSTHTIDAATSASVGQVGTFNDMAILANGSLVVSYLSHLSTAPGITGQATQVKLARSRTPTPASPADWELISVDARAVVAEDVVDEFVEMPKARGLHTSLALDGAVPVIAYYDASDGDVRVARVDGTTVSAVVIDGDAQNGRLSGDVGRFPAVGVINSDLVVSYEDFSRHTVRVWRGPKGTPGVGGSYAIADQLREPTRSGSRFVGAGARLSTEGRPVLVYQDASTLDLRLATLEGASFAPTTIISDGANGFYADVAVVGNKAYICSVVAELDARGKERSRLRLDVHTLP
jgi:hypothetical protein